MYKMSNIKMTMSSPYFYEKVTRQELSCLIRKDMSLLGKTFILLEVV